MSVESDLPLFIDPFLLFHSKKPEYKKLHLGIIMYLTFLRDHAADDLDPGLIKSWYYFKEVKQNWLGFTVLGNGGSGLGEDFAEALRASLAKILTNFGQETITQGSHLEKLTLIKSGVGRDSISDFTANLIKHYLLDYTQAFALKHINAGLRSTFSVPRAIFNYKTESWETQAYTLPAKDGDFVLLTPYDILTCDDTWISHSDMIKKFIRLPGAAADDVLRAQINRYFKSLLSDKPTIKERTKAAQETINTYPQLIDQYIREKEDNGEMAEGISQERRRATEIVFVDDVRAIVADLKRKTNFYEKPISSYEEALDKVHAFKKYIENQDGYRLLHHTEGKPFSSEKDVQLFFGLLLVGSNFDINREPNNGRGPVDFKVSVGAANKSLIEIKLASSTSLKRNLEHQVAIYEKANNTRNSVKMIVCYTNEQQQNVVRILRELKLESEPTIVVIDARNDNKPSASKADSH